MHATVRPFLTRGHPDARLATALDACLHAWLGMRVDRMLAVIDDGLFAMAVTASTTADEATCFSAMQDLRSRRADFADLLGNGLIDVATGLKAGHGHPKSGRPDWDRAFAAAASRAEMRHAAARRSLAERLPTLQEVGPGVADRIIDAHCLAECLACMYVELDLPRQSLEMLVTAAEDALFSQLGVYWLECGRLLGDAPAQERPHAGHGLATDSSSRLAAHRAGLADRGRLSASLAQRLAEQWILTEIGGSSLPPSAMELVREGWRKALVQALLEGGEQGVELQTLQQGLRRFLALWRAGAACIPEDLADLMVAGMLRAGCDALRAEILLRAADEELSRWDPPAPQR